MIFHRWVRMKLWNVLTLHLNDGFGYFLHCYGSMHSYSGEWEREQKDRI